MTPLEVTVKLLAAHDLILSPGGYWNCRCGLPMDAKGAHAAHVAGMLAAAGVVMGVQEWGVRLRSDHPRITPTDDRADAEQRVKLARVRIYPHATVVSRFTGATAWTAEEGL